MLPLLYYHFAFQLYLGSPIICWVPMHFTYSHTMYANSYCWVKNTYYLPMGENIPDPEVTDKKMITYYQWVSNA